jgi:cytochrome oxidase Cu insertion factor (SCO1/SenC/PrrC family)
VSQPRSGRPGWALIALVAIVMITAAWWALALWPAGAVEPEWLTRSRAACFGAGPGGLPDAGGWILLIGEPVGMAAFLLSIWGSSLAADLRRLRADRVWRTLGSGFAAAVIVGFVTLGFRATRTYAAARSPTGQGVGFRTRLDVDAPRIALVDQSGRRVSFSDLRGRPVLVTFAFGHCATVCPTIVRDLAAARRATNRGDVRLVVITLDPWRDTPDRLASIATHWGIVGQDDRVLSGSVVEVEAALDALGVGRRRNPTTGDIEHGGTVVLVDERGKVAWRVDGGWGRVGDLLARR